MAPLKLEDNMKERLEERKIEPTAAAWDRIASKLDAEEGKENNNKVLWLAIAASFIAGIFITLFLITDGNSSGSKDQLVETPQTEDLIIREEMEVTPPKFLEENNSEQEQLVEVQEMPAASEKNTMMGTGIQEKEEIVQNTAEKKMRKEMKNTPFKDPAVVKETTTIVENKLKESPTTILEEPKDPLKEMVKNEIEGIVAKVDLNTVTDEEIDALLLNAQRDIISKQLFNSETNKVDANALLLDVEAEVDPATFRDKVYDALKGGFQKARDAVADRNN